MDWLLRIEWDQLLLPTLSPIEIVVRGSLVYLGTFVLLRIIDQRDRQGRRSVSQ